MQKAKKSTPSRYLLILAFIILICLFMSVASFAAEIPLASNSNGYITNITVRASKNESKNIPGFEFNQNQATYAISFLAPSSSSYRIDLSFNSELPSNFRAEYRIDGAATGTEIKQASPFIAFTTLNSKLTSGTDHVLSIVCGQYNKSNKTFTDSDVYNFTITKLPSFTNNGLTVKDAEGNAITLTPEYRTDTSYAYQNQFSCSVPGNTQTIFITPTFNANSANAVTIGNQENVATGTAVEIELSQYQENAYVVGADVAIPITLQYNGKNGAPPVTRTIDVLVVYDKTPIITKQPQSGINTDKFTTVELSVEADAAPGGELSYQWYRNIDNRGFLPISNATSATFAPSTERAGVYCYKCEVINTQDGVSTSVFTDEAELTVNLSEITLPAILQQPGTFAYIKGIDHEFKQTYEAGSRLDAVPIRVVAPEDGVDYSYEFYYNTTCSTDGATLMTEREGIVGTQNNVNQSINGIKTWFTNLNFEERFAEGTYYFFYKITASCDGLKSVVTYSDIFQATFQTISFEINLKGNGTKESPYLIGSVSDLEVIRDAVKNSCKLSGVYFEMTDDIELPLSWEQIGDRSYGQLFSGVLDGKNHTITVAKGGKSLFKTAGECTIKNLKIYGEDIQGCGLIDEPFVDYGEDGTYWTGCPEGPTLENISLLSGTKTLLAGLMQGTGSGANTTYIRNCVVEKGVTIGNEQSGRIVGSFVGHHFNGIMDDCVSYADVYGVGAVGGLVGSKGESMGACMIRNSAFIGTIHAQNGAVGGIIGRGYTDDSAPNTPPVSIINCYVHADIFGGDNVGGIFGGELGLKVAFNNGFIRDNLFYGSISTEGENVGGIVGFYGGIDKFIEIENNYFYETSGNKLDAIGRVGRFDGVDSTLDLFKMTQEQEDRYKAAFQSAPKTKEQMTDGTVLSLLNSGSYQNWTQDEEHPIIDATVVVPRSLSVSESDPFKTIYNIGDELDMTGSVFTVTYSNGAQETVEGDSTDITYSGFDSSVRGPQTVTATYGPVSAEFKVTVLLPDSGTASDTITVYFKLLGDDKHDSDIDGKVHTLEHGGLQTWVPNRAYTVDHNATVWDLLQEVLPQYNIICGNPSGNYIEDMTYNGVTIGEFSNGPNSGWMYTLNGEHPLFGVQEQFLSDGDEIVWHYTDDWTQESGAEFLAQPDPNFSGSTKKDEKKDETATSETTTNTITADDGSTVQTETEKTVDTKTNDDGSVTETVTEKTTTTVTDPDGKVTATETVVETETTTNSVKNSDGTVTETEQTVEKVTETVTAADGTKQTTVTETEETKELNTTTSADGKVSGTGTYSATSTVTVDGKKTTAVTEGTVAVSTDDKGTVSEVTTAKTTTTAPDGTKTETVAVITEAEMANGTTGKVVADEQGNTISAEASVSQAAVEAAAKSGAPIEIPVTVNAASGATVSISLEGAGEGSKLWVEIGTTETAPGNVAYLKLAEGVTKLLTTCKTGSVIVPVEGSCEVIVKDNSKSFSDVDAGAWYGDSVKFVTAREIFNGNGDSTFAPGATMNRAMAAQILYNLDGEAKAGDGTGFSDVTADDWFNGAVGWASGLGVINGYNGAYAPLDAVTRQDLVTILYRYAKQAGYNVSAGSVDLTAYADGAEVASYAAEAMRWAIGVGLIKGYEDNTLRPTATATRAEVAAIMQRLVQSAVK